MNKYIFNILAALTLTVGCASSCSSQLPVAVSEKPSAAMQEKMRGWQDVEIADDAITFKVPPDWKQLSSDLDNEQMMINSNEYRSRVWWLAGEHIKISMLTYTKGFPASPEEMLKIEYRYLTAWDNELQAQYLTIGNIKGIAYTWTVKDGREKERRKVSWSGYRNGEKAQRIDIEISGYSENLEQTKAVLQTLDFSGDQKSR